MKSVTKILALLLALVLCVSVLAACETKPGETTAPTGSKPAGSNAPAKLNKDISMVSELQMEILTRAYTYDGAMERLRTRRWAVIPDFVGMEGDAAIALCEMTGFRPKVVYEQFSMGGFPEDEVGVITEAHIGLVIYQDGPAGFAYEVGMPLQLNMLTDK